jgi:hypothetical protein
MYLVCIQCSELICFQSFCFRQLGLAVVEGPKYSSFEFERACDMQAVEDAQTEGAAVAASELSTEFKGAFGHGRREPQSAGSILLEFLVDSLRLDARHLAPKHLTRERVGPFSKNERCDMDKRLLPQESVNFCRMRALNVDRDNKARISVNPQ